MDDFLDFDNDKKLSNDEDIECCYWSKSSNEFGEQKRDNSSKRNKKKKNMNMIEDFSEKRFKVIMNWSIIFEEC